MLRARSDTLVQEEIIREIRALSASYGVCCFTERADDIAMWSYYAAGHTGLCLRFLIDGLLEEFQMGGRGVLLPVQYVVSPSLNYYEASDTRRTWAVIATKATAWEHEREWRLVLPEESGHVPCAIGRLDGVLFGCRTTQEDRQWVRELLAFHRLDIEVLEALMVRNEYSLEIRST